MVQLAALVAETAPQLMNTVFRLCSSYIHRKRWSFHQSLLYLWKSSRIHCGWNRESWWIHSLDGSKCHPPVEHHPAVMGIGKTVDSVVQAVIWHSQSSALGTWPQPQPLPWCSCCRWTLKPPGAGRGAPMVSRPTTGSRLQVTLCWAPRAVTRYGGC